MTGFGLLGHLYKLARASGVTAVVDVAAVPYLEGAREAVRDGHVSGGTRRNLAWVEPHLDPGSCDAAELLLLADAQTSGGFSWRARSRARRWSASSSPASARRCACADRARSRGRGDVLHRARVPACLVPGRRRTGGHERSRPCSASGMRGSTAISARLAKRYGRHAVKPWEGCCGSWR
ncbi:hypothetical protein [Microtetraspora malaysiensis]|uniref:hypothetical protein n=1 Tax=Microtetraspora malaysiensis TaxID=161358 RepID=UPI003D936E19